MPATDAARARTLWLREELRRIEDRQERLSSPTRRRSFWERLLNAIAVP